MLFIQIKRREQYEVKKKEIEYGQTSSSSSDSLENSTDNYTQASA